MPHLNILGMTYSNSFTSSMSCLHLLGHGSKKKMGSGQDDAKKPRKQLARQLRTLRSLGVGSSSYNNSNNKIRRKRDAVPATLADKKPKYSHDSGCSLWTEKSGSSPSSPQSPHCLDAAAIQLRPSGEAAVRGRDLADPFGFCRADRLYGAQPGPPPSKPLPAPPIRAQQQSPLLRLPQEIRDEIYAYVFGSTRLTMGRRKTCVPHPDSSKSRRHGSHSARHDNDSHGDEDSSSYHVTLIRPARHSLALFSVCRQIHRELHADDAWLSQVLFNFEDIATMMDVLGGTSGPGGQPAKSGQIGEAGSAGHVLAVPSPLASPEGRAKVREVRVREGGLARHTPHRGTCGFLLGGLMRLLPGLCLDRLTILPALPCRVHASSCPSLSPSSSFSHLSSSSSSSSFSASSPPPSPPSLSSSFSSAASFNNPPLPSRSGCCAGGTGGGNARVAAHDVLGELLRTGYGWRELCYLHSDAGLLAADRRPPGSLEAMMVNMGFWDADADAFEELWGSSGGIPMPARQVEPMPIASYSSLARTAAATPTPFRERPLIGNFFSHYAETREFRLPGWRAILTSRDAQDPFLTSETPSSSSLSSSSSSSLFSFSESTVDVYGICEGAATEPLESLGDVHLARLRGEDFMVVARRNANTTIACTASAPYPHADGDPRTLGYGTTWPELRSFLFPWDFIPVTRTRYDRYSHRDEYVVGPQQRLGDGLGK